jgi:hypothetical protein
VISYDHHGPRACVARDWFSTNAQVDYALGVGVLCKWRCGLVVRGTGLHLEGRYTQPTLREQRPVVLDIRVLQCDGSRRTFKLFVLHSAITNIKSLSSLATFLETTFTDATKLVRIQLPN